jgi:hypothetical protein
MQDVFEAIRDIVKNYNWLISDYECNNYPSDKIPDNMESIFLSGEELCEIIYNNEIQFIWGVLSGFSKEIPYAEIEKYRIPIAEGNGGLWETDIKTQNPFAEIEIISWDSTLVIFISSKEDVIRRFLEYYPLSQDLKEYNSAV